MKSFFALIAIFAVATSAFVIDTEVRDTEIEVDGRDLGPYGSNEPQEEDEVIFLEEDEFELLEENDIEDEDENDNELNEVNENAPVLDRSRRSADPHFYKKKFHKVHKKHRRPKHKKIIIIKHKPKRKHKPKYHYRPSYWHYGYGK